MASATVHPDSGVPLSLKAEDQPTFGIFDLKIFEVEPSSSALDRTLERLAAAGTSDLQRDLGYSCEWWLPD